MNVVTTRRTRPPWISAVQGEPTPTAASVKPGVLPHHWRTSSRTAGFGRPWAAPR